MIKVDYLKKQKMITSRRLLSRRALLGLLVLVGSILYLVNVFVIPVLHRTVPDRIRTRTKNKDVSILCDLYAACPSMLYSPIRCI